MSIRSLALVLAVSVVVAFGAGWGTRGVLEHPDPTGSPDRVPLPQVPPASGGNAVSNALVAELRRAAGEKLPREPYKSGDDWDWMSKVADEVDRHIRERSFEPEQLVDAMRAANVETELHGRIARVLCRAAFEAEPESAAAAMVDVGNTSFHETTAMMALAFLYRYRQPPQRWLEPFGKWTTPNWAHPDRIAVMFLESAAGEDWGVRFPSGADQDFVAAKRRAYEYVKERLAKSEDSD